ncbi:MAG: GNAT family N-acetyltransferase [Solobacterium sp.]|nr:GNAT family N-acetyltransferase [Solobacterium sp.]
MITVRRLGAEDPFLDTAAQYAERIPWRAGQSLARKIREGYFKDWESLFILQDADRICGFLTVSAKDSIETVPFTPFIGYVFVEEGYRGQRLSQKMIACAEEYLASAGFREAYIFSDHEGLYEKFGYIPAGEYTTKKNTVETLFRKELDSPHRE